jgi:hypothetical protein
VTKKGGRKGPLFFNWETYAGQRWYLTVSETDIGALT